MEGFGMDDGYKEEGGGEMMDKDELEELLGLRVQFGDTAPPVPMVPCKEPAVGDREESNHWPGGGKSDSFSQHVQVDIGGEAFKTWSDIGAAQGLHSDPQIATFLLQHYENTKRISFPGGNCTVCNQPLSLFCSQCRRPVQPLPLSAAASPSPTTEESTKKRSTLKQPSKMGEKTASKVVTFSNVRKKRGEKMVDSAAFVIKPDSGSDGPMDDGSDGSGDYDDGGTVTCKHEGKSQENGQNADIKLDEKEDPVENMTSVTQGTKLHRDKGKKKSRKLNSKQRPGAAKAGGEEGKVFECVVCSRAYTRACSLKVHMRKHTGEKPFKCKGCDATFSLSGSLIVHQRTHTGDKPFVCEECGQRFSISNALKQHRRQHTGEKPYHCKICFSKYSRSDSLKVHMRTHSGDRPFICEICGADFSRLYCLIAHKKKHSGERPFKCSQCPAAFVQSGKLTIHMRKHTGDRPFQCEQCGASFTQSERLKTHLRIHSGEKPYRCGECGKRFSHPHSLKVHGRVHTGDKPYKCEVCALTFADPSYFRRHKAKHASASELGAGTVASGSDPHSVVAAYLDTTATADDFAAPLSGAESMNAFHVAAAGGITLSSNMIAAAFPEATASPENMDSPDCFSETTAGFSIPLCSVPSLGFSGPGSTGLGFAVPSAMADGADSASSISASDPFAFLRTALHCPGSYPN